MFYWSGKILLIILQRFVIRIHLHGIYMFILRVTFVTATDVSYPSFVLMCGLFERAVLEFVRIDSESHANVSHNWSGAKIRAPSSNGNRSAINYIGHLIWSWSYIALVQFRKHRDKWLRPNLYTNLLLFLKSNGSA